MTREGRATETKDSHRHYLMGFFKEGPGQQALSEIGRRALERDDVIVAHSTTSTDRQGSAGDIGTFAYQNSSGMALIKSLSRYFADHWRTLLQNPEQKPYASFDYYYEGSREVSALGI